MVGHSTGGKNPVDMAAAAKPAMPDNAQGQAAVGETHAVTPDSPETAESSSTATVEKPSPAATTHVVASSTSASKPAGTSESNLRAFDDVTRSEAGPEQAHEEADLAAPRGRHTYLQVAALKHSEALTVAKVLNRKGFHAQISPKAGTSFFRVLVGPVHNAGELNATRAALKSKGFREVFVQHL
jgi:cell division septation protein DedD